MPAPRAQRNSRPLRAMTRSATCRDVHVQVAAVQVDGDHGHLGSVDAEVHGAEVHGLAPVFGRTAQKLGGVLMKMTRARAAPGLR